MVSPSTGTNRHQRHAKCSSYLMPVHKYYLTINSYFTENTLNLHCEEPVHAVRRSVHGFFTLPHKTYRQQTAAVCTSEGGKKTAVLPRCSSADSCQYDVCSTYCHPTALLTAVNMSTARTATLQHCSADSWQYVYITYCHPTALLTAVNMSTSRTDTLQHC